MSKVTFSLFPALAAICAGAIDFSNLADLKFAESYAFSSNRAEVIASLRPKTKAWFAYSAMLAINEGRFDDADKLINAWFNLPQGDPAYDYRMAIDFSARLNLLRWDKVAATGDAAFTEKNIRDFLVHPLHDIGFYAPDYNREVELAPNTYPAKLNQNELSFKAFWDFFKTNHRFGLAEEFAFLPILGLADAKAPSYDFSPAQLDILPDTPGVFEATLAYLKDDNPGHAFRKLGLYPKLTLAQLETLEKELADTKNDLRNNSDFIEIVLAKLAPGADEPRYDPAAPAARGESARAWLERILSFSRTLAPAQDQLRVLALYNLLDLHRQNGDFSHRDLFLEYVKAPRTTSVHNAKHTAALAEWRTRQDLRQSRHHSLAPVLKTVQDDSGLVRDYLAAFRREGSDLAEFADWIDGKFLARTRAETDLLAGKPAETVDTSVFSDGDFKALRERVELDWSKANPREFAADADVALDIDVKNVKTMRVAIYDVDAFSACRQLDDEIPADIDLDACVPNHERTLDYSKFPQMTRHAERLAFPELKKPGLYVVECSGAGVCSRAVIRKGRLRVTERVDSRGHVFTALDESGKTIREAKIWLDGTVFTAGEDGGIIVPFFAEKDAGALKSAVVGAGRLATTTVFHAAAESYALGLAAVLPPESLVADKTATLLLSPALSLADRKISIANLDKPVLTVTFTDLDGVASVKTVENPKLADDAEFAYSFKVPARLHGVSARLSGSVRNRASGKDVALEASSPTFSVNGIAETDTIGEMLLRHGKNGYSLELRGRAGEPLPSRAVSIRLSHRAFRNDKSMPKLQADANGVIDLGELRDITAIKAECAGVTPGAWLLDKSPLPAVKAIHAAEGEVIEMPVRNLFDGDWPGAKDFATRLSLLAQNENGEITGDYLEAASYSNGVLRVEGLPAGDYALTFRAENSVIDISVTRPAAPTLDGGVLAGRNRGLADIGNPSLMRISSAKVEDGTLRLEIENASPETRVHIIGGRIAPAEANPFAALVAGISQPPLKTYLWGDASAEYISGRNLGDKLRYVLDRRSLPHLPGTMLAKPSLLLTPWSPTDTTAKDITLREGEGWENREAPAAQGIEQKASFGPYGGFAAPLVRSDLCCDFLPSAAQIWSNLKPGEDGAVVFKLPEGVPFQDFAVLALDNFGFDQVRLLGETQGIAPRDIRFHSGLDADRPTTIAKTAQIIRPGDIAAGKATNDAPAAQTTLRTKTYAALPDLFRLLKSLSIYDEYDSFADFEFVSKWASLPAAEKNALYGKYACHELDLFLYFKDRKFFDAVIAPNLRNKRFPQFIDQWLLGADLSAYTEPGRLQNLNALEQCLLAKRVPALAPILAKRFADWCDTHPVSPEDTEERFVTALDIAAEREAFGDDSAMACAEAPGIEGMAQDCDYDIEMEECEPPSPAKAKARGGNRAAYADAKPMALDGQQLWSNQAAILPMAPDGRARMERPEMKAMGALRRANMPMLGEAVGAKRETRQFYRPPERTREWVETHYYRRRHAEDTLSLARVNAFWRDYAAAIADGTDGDFLSGSVVDAVSTFTEKMAALAVLALPFEEKDAKAGAILFAETRRELAGENGGDNPVGVIQRFVDPEGATPGPGGEMVAKYVADEFVQGKVYTLLTVVTNPSDQMRRIDTFAQIPEGAIPLARAKASASVTQVAGPYSVRTFRTPFYFPSAGKGVGAVYPATVTEGGALRGRGTAFACNVVPKATKIDKASWGYVSQNGTPEEVLDFIRAANLESPAFDIAKMGWRMRDAAFRAKAYEILDTRGFFSDTLWACTLRDAKAADVPRIKQMLARRDTLRKVANALGPYFKTALVAVEPEETDLFEHREYWPLINARAHAIAGAPTIANNDFAAEYRAFLDVLAAKPAPSAKDRLLAAVFLLAQDRVAEAEAQAAFVKPADVATKMQLDYLVAYLDFCKGQPEDGRKIAEPYRDYPVPLWRDRFREIIAQADEIAGKPSRFDEHARDEAALAPSLSLAAASKNGATDEIVVTSRNLASCSLRAYPVDVEIGFSKNPFGTTADGNATTYLRPAWEQEVKLADGRETHVQLPEALRKTNLVIEAAGADGRATARLEATHGMLDVQVAKEYGQLRVRDAAGKALPGTYVKVYAKDGYGREVRFHKDGYTDLRGAFDYASVSTDSDFAPAEFAILVLHDVAGVKTLTAPGLGGN